MNTVWQKIHAMTEDELVAYATQRKVEFTTEFDDLEAAADFVSAELQVENPAKGDDVGSELDEKVQAYQRKHGGTYAEALLTVLKQNPDLGARYRASF